MWKEHQFKETDVRVGLGTGFCVMDTSAGESKYHIFAAVESMPEVTGETDTVEFSTTTNPTKTNVEGKKSLNNPEINLPYSLDNIKMLERYKGKTLKLAYIDFNDFTAQEFTGSITYRVGEIATDSPKILVVTITTKSIVDGITEDVYDIYQDTIQFDNVPMTIVIEKGEGQTSYTAQEVAVETNPSGATTTAKVVGTTGVATATLTAGKLSIAATNAGSTIIELQSSLTGYATNYKYIKVIVK